MNLLQDKVKTLYFKYLFSAFGSALISCIYTIVDMIVVGQYIGPDGTAALACIAPIWNLIFSLGLFMGVGGSILLSLAKGKNSSSEEGNQYFTVSMIGSLFLAFIAELVLIFFEKPIMIFFGASNDTLLNLTHKYLVAIKFVFPAFLFNQMLSAFLRNDNNPRLATIATLAGGIFNIFGDIFFTFTLNLGVFGAGLATSIGSIITFSILITHFFRKRNTLRIVKINNFAKKMIKIVENGFSTFFVDAAMGFLTIIFNKQIMKYLGSDALAIYGTIITISTFVQCCAYSVGQASQPIISINYGAKKVTRIKETLKYSIYTIIVFSIFWTLISVIAPKIYIYIFMKPTDNILNIGSNIIRIYSISYLLLPFNIFSTYYFQSIIKSKISFIISVTRGFLLSGALILLLPFISPNAIWFAMLITESIVFIYAIFMMIKYTKRLSK